MAVSKKMKNALNGSSIIRRMFNEGTRLKKLYGEKNVYDFSLGNPHVPPPEEFTKSVMDIMKADIPMKHGYMNGSGYLETREYVAEFLSRQQKTEITSDNVVMTCGAGSAMNLVIRSILNPGDNIVVSTPNFVLYKTYTENFGGELRTVPCLDNFYIDVDLMETYIDENTAAVIINSPNNPSGVIYPQSVIDSLCIMLKNKSDELGRKIYLLSDEPYRDIVFDGIIVPPLFNRYENSILVSSYSKSLSIPGERIGWGVVHPKAEDVDLIIAAMVIGTTALGFTNAPALMQRAITAVKEITVDPEIYRKKRDLLAKPLKEMGYDFILPHGTFYLFIKVPGGDDTEFIESLQKELILAVPGSGFNMSGYFRLAYCVDDSVITGSIPGFKRAIDSLKVH